MFFFEPILINENAFNKNHQVYYASEIYQSNVLENAMWFGRKLQDEQQWKPHFKIEHQNSSKKIYLNFQIEVILAN